MRRKLIHAVVLSAGVWLLSIAQVAGAGDSRLIDAVRDRNIASVRVLIKQRADVNAAQGDGITPLHWAVHSDDLPMAELLIRAGARVSAADDVGVTPVYLACTNRSSAIVEFLLKAGADPNATLLNGETVLMNCSRTGNAASVKALLKAGARVNDKEKAHDQTALMWAAAQAHPEAVRALIEGGADIRARSRVYSQMVTGEQTQRAGREELSYTTLRGGSTPLLFAAQSGDVESARCLLQAGADPNDASPSGMSALIQAAYGGHAGVAILLTEHGADPNEATIGYTALHAAVLRSQLDLVRVLLARGASPNALTTKGTPIRRNTTDFNLPATLIGATPYLLAAKFLEADIMRALVAGGADPSLAMKDGTTAIMLAAGIGVIANSNRRGVAVLDGGVMENENSLVDSVMAALELGADVTGANQAGDTALHGSAALGYEKVVQLLAEKGALLNARNKRGVSPLALARGAGRRGAANVSADGSTGPVANQRTVDLLLKLGATE